MSETQSTFKFIIFQLNNCKQMQTVFWSLDMSSSPTTNHDIYCKIIAIILVIWCGKICTVVVSIFDYSNHQLSWGRIIHLHNFFFHLLSILGLFLSSSCLASWITCLVSILHFAPSCPSYESRNGGIKSACTLTDEDRSTVNNTPVVMSPRSYLPCNNFILWHGIWKIRMIRIPNFIQFHVIKKINKLFKNFQNNKGHIAIQAFPFHKIQSVRSMTSFGLTGPYTGWSFTNNCYDTIRTAEKVQFCKGCYSDLHYVG